ncbi:MAG: aminoacyl-tRNA hydrolase [Thermoguttaceae bacterium]|nr:aminoacyl-tRNA hydrolase [Thermoguttaceae bacterium]
MQNKPILPSEAGAASEAPLAPSVGGPTLDVPGVASIPLAEIEFEFVRSSGPGGQNVNKVSSKARLRWRPGERLAPEVWERFQRLYPSWTTEAGDVVVSSQKFRDAPKNKADCLEKLRAALEKAGRAPKKRIPTKPTRGSILRRLADKKRNSDKKKERGRRDFD